MNPQESGVQIVVGITDSGNVGFQGVRFDGAGGMTQLSAHESMALVLRAVHFYHLSQAEAEPQKPQLVMASGGLIH